MMSKQLKLKSSIKMYQFANCKVKIINQSQVIIDVHHQNHRFGPMKQENSDSIYSQIANKKGAPKKHSQSSSSERNFYNISAEPNKHPKPQQKKPVAKQISSSTLINCLYACIKQVKVLPTILVHELQKRQKKFDPSDPLIYYPFHPKDLNFSVKTHEGKQGVQNLIRYLQDMQSRQSQGLGNCVIYQKVAKEVSVEWSHELHLAAHKRITAIQRGDGAVQSQDIGQLVSEFGSWKGPLCEMVVYGFIDPRQILIEGLLEDGSRAKNNRGQFFNEGNKLVGVDMGQHEKYQVVTVIILAGGVNKLNKGGRFSGVYTTTSQECKCSVW